MIVKQRLITDDEKFTHDACAVGNNFRDLITEFVKDAMEKCHSYDVETILQSELNVLINTTRIELRCKEIKNSVNNN